MNNRESKYSGSNKYEFTHCNVTEVAREVNEVVSVIQQW